MRGSCTCGVLRSYRLRNGRWLRKQLASHIKTDGIGGYLSALVRGLADTKVSSTFISRKMLKAARQFLPFVGYGIYVGEKAD